jgi:cobalt-zinc-cadmium efflux system outer membrane protein
MEAQNKTRRAYESGRYSYLDLIAAQQSLLEAKAMLIRSAATALQAGVVIERLTGVSLSPEVIQKKTMEGDNQ